MNVDGIKRAADWPFPMEEGLAQAIDELLSAMGREDIFVGDYMDDVQGWARTLPAELDGQVYDYYLRGGWQRDAAE